MNRPIFGKFHITEIPDNVEKLENTRMFIVLLNFFIRQKKREEAKEGKDFDYEPKDIIWSEELFKDFELFENKMYRRNKIIIDAGLCDKYDILIDDYKKRLNSNFEADIIYVDKIPDDVKLEDMDFFKKLIESFIDLSKKQGKIYDKEDIKYSSIMFGEFKEFIFDRLSLKELCFDKELVSKYKVVFRDFEDRHSYGVKSVEKFYDDIYNAVFLSQGYGKFDIEVKGPMLKFNNAYHMMKSVFHNIKRESKDESGKYIRYFEHLKETMDIVIKKIPYPTLDKILIALLHDLLEDIPSITYREIKSIFSEHIANGVLALSKKDWKEYLKDNEISVIENQPKDSDIYILLKKTAKERRSFDYFGHLKDLSDCFFDVKCADRLHNLSTLQDCSIDKVIKKIKETEKYFMSAAQERKENRKTDICFKIIRLTKSLAILDKDYDYTKIIQKSNGFILNNNIVLKDLTDIIIVLLNRIESLQDRFLYEELYKEINIFLSKLEGRDFVYDLLQEQLLKLKEEYKDYL